MVYLVFKGARLDFLTEKLAGYSAAVTEGTTKDFLNVVYACYARRFPIDLPLGEDPSPEFLAAVDDDAPEPENEVCIEDLSPEELEAEEQKRADRRVLIQKRRRQITTWFQYRHMKQHSVDPRATDPSNPFTSLLYSITGVHATDKPRQKSAVNCWSKSAIESINKLVRQWCIVHDVGRKNSMAVWNRIAKEEFSKLPPTEQQQWEQKAKEDHAREVEKWQASKDAAISTKPEDRQRCIEGMVRLGQEFVDKAAEATGWKWSLIGGGPEPASAGKLHLMSLHGGTTNSEVPLSFGQKEHEAYSSQIVPIYSKFLRACYTPEECRNRSLTEEGTIPLAEAGLEEMGITLDAICPLEDATLLTLQSTSNSTSTAAPVANQLNTTSTTAAPVANQPNTTSTATSVANQLSVTSPTARISNHPVTLPLNADLGTQRRQSRTPSPPLSVVPTPLGSPATHINNHPVTVPLNVDLGTRQCQSRTPSPPLSVVPTPLGSPVHSPSRRGQFITPLQSPTATDTPYGDKPLSAAATASPLVNASSAVTTSAANYASPVGTSSTTTADSASTDGLPADKSPTSTTTPANPASVLVPAPSPVSNSSTTVPNMAAPNISANSHGMTGADGADDAPESHSSKHTRGRKREAPSGLHLPPSKRGRTSSTAPVLANPLADSHWYVNSLAMLKTDVLGDAWNGLVGAWIAFEVASHGQDNGLLPATHRPSAVYDWIQRKRRPDYRPVINDSKAFGDKHVAWWISLQPEWRIADDIDDANYDAAEPLHDSCKLARDDQGDFEKLRKPGVNGLLSIVASLYFWGTAVHNSGKKSRRWLQFVDDCMYVLQRLASAA